MRALPIELKHVARLSAVAHALIELLEDLPVCCLEDGGGRQEGARGCVGVGGLLIE